MLATPYKRKRKRPCAEWVKQVEEDMKTKRPKKIYTKIKLGKEVGRKWPNELLTSFYIYLYHTEKYPHKSAYVDWMCVMLVPFTHGT